MRSEGREHLCCSDALPNAPINACSIVEDDTCWHSFDAFEDVLESLADTFRILAREYLRKTNIRVREGQYEIAQALLRPKDKEAASPKSACASPGIQSRSRYRSVESLRSFFSS